MSSSSTTTRTDPSAAPVPTQPGQRRLQRYTCAAATDIRKTFARARRELARQAGKEAA